MHAIGYKVPSPLAFLSREWLVVVTGRSIASSSRFFVRVVPRRRGTLVLRCRHNNECKRLRASRNSERRVVEVRGEKRRLSFQGASREVVDPWIIPASNFKVRLRFQQASSTAVTITTLPSLSLYHISFKRLAIDV